MPPFQLDDIDKKILKELQDEARISNVELSARVGPSPAPCLRRVRSLEESGAIRKYVTLVNPSALRLGVTVFVQMSLDLQVERRLKIFETAIMRHPEVMECYLMTGDADYLLRIVVSDVAKYEHFLRESLTRIESVASIKSSFALKTSQVLDGVAPRCSQRGSILAPSDFAPDCPRVGAIDEAACRSAVAHTGLYVHREPHDGSRWSAHQIEF